MRINVESMFLASKHAIPAMLASGGGGAIVNVASIAAMLPSKLTAYATSKGAVISLTKAMAVDHGRDGIRVNCVAPGPVHTPTVDLPAQAGDEPAKAEDVPGMPDAMREARRRASLLGIEGTGWDVGQAVRFLLSDRARYITGHTLVVDGGTLLRGPTRRMEALQEDNREH
jgi:NAD(P)-dependent dehydrogenase (short-subunit alcohol dehydrogenase family)